MVKDFYTRDDSYISYKNDILEINDELSDLIIKIENTLFTDKGEVLGCDGFGCNLDDMIFTTILSGNYIEENILNQIHGYCLIPEKFKVDCKVSFFEIENRKGALVDIYINDERMLGITY